MGQLRNIVTPLHQATNRDCLARMIDDKVECMEIAKQYEKDYWDGDRRHGCLFFIQWCYVSLKLIRSISVCNRVNSNLPE